MLGARILLVDDDPLVRNAVGGMLEKAGYDVDTHDSGFGLALAIRESQPELILLDVSMPGLRGDSALRAVDSLSHDLPPSRVVLFSGMPVAELRDMAARLGVKSIHKPIAATDLLREVASLLADDVPAAI